MKLKKQMNSLNAPSDNTGNVTLAWSSCLACQEGNDNACSCPACNVGDDDNCYCDNGYIMGPDGPDADNSAEGGDPDGAMVATHELMAKAQQLMLVNQALKETITSFSEIISLSKGWLPEGTSQNDLDNGDFLWVSSAYASGASTDKAAGRKFPISVHGKVDPHGWLAAWNVLHGSQGGADYSGGPSKMAVMAKLMAKKPSSITMANGHASLAKANEINFPNYISIEKSDVNIKMGIIFGKASVAGVADREGDVISEEELEKAAYKFMENANKRATNTHNEDIPGKWVSSYVEKGVWTVGFKPDDIQVAFDAANGLYVGWSIGGTGIRIPIPYNATFWN